MRLHNEDKTHLRFRNGELEVLLFTDINEVWTSLESVDFLIPRWITNEVLSHAIAQRIYPLYTVDEQLALIKLQHPDLYLIPFDGEIEIQRSFYERYP